MQILEGGGSRTSANAGDTLLIRSYLTLRLWAYHLSLESNTFLPLSVFSLILIIVVAERETWRGCSEQIDQIPTLTIVTMSNDQLTSILLT